LTWIDDITEWTRLKTYEKVKRTAEDRKRWKTIVVNLLSEDDTFYDDDDDEVRLKCNSNDIQGFCVHLKYVITKVSCISNIVL